MKRNPLIYFGGALIAAVSCVWLATDRAEARYDIKTANEAPYRPYEFPFGRPCVITLDPFGGAVPQLSGEAYLHTGLDAPNTLEGQIVHSDAHWIVIRDGDTEDWVARERVLIVHVIK